MPANPNQEYEMSISDCFREMEEHRARWEDKSFSRATFDSRYYTDEKMQINDLKYLIDQLKLDLDRKEDFKNLNDWIDHLPMVDQLEWILRGQRGLERKREHENQKFRLEEERKQMELRWKEDKITELSSNLEESRSQVQRLEERVIWSDNTLDSQKLSEQKTSAQSNELRRLLDIYARKYETVSTELESTRLEFKDLGHEMQSCERKLQECQKANEVLSIEKWSAAQEIQRLDNRILDLKASINRHFQAERDMTDTMARNQSTAVQKLQTVEKELAQAKSAAAEDRQKLMQQMQQHQLIALKDKENLQEEFETANKEMQAKLEATERLLQASMMKQQGLEEDLYAIRGEAQALSDKESFYRKFTLHSLER